MLEQIDYIWCRYLWQTLFQTFFYMYFIKILTKKPHFFLISPTESTYLVVKFLSAMQRKFSWHSFLGGRKKKYGMCFCTWHFLQFSSHLAQSGVGCLWPPPSTSTFTHNYTTTQAKGHTKLLRILIQYTYMPSLEYGQYCTYWYIS